MKIYLLFRNPFPYGMAPSQHVTCESLGLAEAGADLEVVVFSPPFDKGKDNGLPCKGQFRNITYCYIHGKIRPTNVGLQLVNRFWNTIKSFFWGLNHYRKGDIVYSYGGDNLTLLLFSWAAHIKGAKIVVELVEIPFYGDEWYSRLRRWFSTTFLFTNFDAFVCISHTLLDFAKQYARKSVPMFLLPILVEEEEKQVSKPSPYDVPYIIHTGSMSERKDGISHILKGFAEFKRSDTSSCRLVFTGPDANKETCKYKPLIRELGIADSVDLLGMIATRDDLLNLQRHASMSIVYKVDNIQTRYCFATKIGEILMAGVPLITTNEGEQGYYLKDKESAYIVNSGDVLELSHAIRRVISNSKEAKSVGENGKLVAKTSFNPILQGEELYKFFLKL